MYYAGRETTAADVERFLGSRPAVTAVESAWLERLRSCRLYCATISRRRPSSGSMNALATSSADDLLTALLGRGVELRFVTNLWSVRDAIISSTLRFPIIRMRNALPRVTIESSA